MSVHPVDLETKNKILIEKSGYDAKIDNFSEKVLLLVNVYAVFFFLIIFFFAEFMTWNRHFCQCSKE